MGLIAHGYTGTDQDDPDKSKTGNFFRPDVTGNNGNKTGKYL
jgi:hypothetical protein